MNLPDPLAWWKRLPPKVRIRLLVCAMLLLAGAEAAVVLPMILEVAVLVDSLGVLFVLSVSWSVFAANFAGVRALWPTVVERFNTTLLWSARNFRMATMTAAVFCIGLKLLVGQFR